MHGQSCKACSVVCTTSHTNAAQDCNDCAILQMTEAENANKEVAGDSDSDDDFEEGMGDIDVEKASGLTIEQ